MHGHTSELNIWFGANYREEKVPEQTKVRSQQIYQDGEACQMLQNTLLCPRFWPQLLQSNIHRLNEQRIEEKNHCKEQNNKTWKDLFCRTHLAIDLWSQRYADVILWKCVYKIYSIPNSTSSYYSKHCNTPSHTWSNLAWKPIVFQYSILCCVLYLVLLWVASRESWRMAGGSGISASWPYCTLSNPVANAFFIGHESWVMSHESWIMNHESWIMNHEYWCV